MGGSEEAVQTIPGVCSSPNTSYINPVTSPLLSSCVTYYIPKKKKNTNILACGPVAKSTSGIILTVPNRPATGGTAADRHLKSAAIGCDG